MKTPAMQQYSEIKKNHPDCLVLFRMGDFYETFYEDAKLASRVLDIALTKRTTRKGPGIPLAGIPYHALESYLGRLVTNRIKVAIVEQLEDPRYAKGVVKRGVVRIVTPGTLTETNLLSEKQNAWIASVYSGAVALLDLSTGEFFATRERSPEDVLARYSCSEVILPDDSRHLPLAGRLKKAGFWTETVPARHFSHAQALQQLFDHFQTIGAVRAGQEDQTEETCSGGALLWYVRQTRRSSAGHIRGLRIVKSSEHMSLDRETIRNLELTECIADRTAEGSLLGVIDKTRTGMGARLMRRLLLSPLMNISEINQRLDAVGFLAKDTLKREEISSILSEQKDIERITGKISFGTALPRDLACLKTSIEKLPRLKSICRDGPALIQKISRMPGLEDVHRLLESALADELPASARDGRIFRPGYSSELDELRDILKGGRGYISRLEEQERKRTGIKSLRVGYNRVFGYYFEVTKKHLQNVPGHFVRKQTTAAGERFVTEELKEWEEKTLSAQERQAAMETQLYGELLEKLSGHIGELQTVSESVAMLDCIACFAGLSQKNHYARPVLTERPVLFLEGSRHPVIETLTDSFVPNDIQMSESERMLLITGPNMAGKSTVMRQAALTVIMAQMGMFVPASMAQIGIADRVFSRIGAHDDITHGRSTFLVEMQEVASILNNATEKSLVIMDEIGRGTSTYDGMAIAWAVAEHLFTDISCRTMFATHYHVLTELGRQSQVKNYNMAVRELKDEIVFLRRLVRGGTDKSYGIHVAGLAGMPKPVLEKAREVQSLLEKEDLMRKQMVTEKPLPRKDATPVQRTLNDI